MRELVLPDDFSGGLVKVCSWEPFYKDGLTQVPYVRKLATNRLNSKEQVFAKIAKLQSKDTADLVQAFLDSYPVKVGHTYFLDTALGAFEGWGANSNGDAFLEEDLLLDSEDHGYKSFRKHAHVFRHHQNKDPLASIGRVVLASYNHKMRRVELIEEVDNTKAADLLQKWDDEGSLGTSMGCKVAFDICMVCQNRAKTAAEYCKHAKYEMNHVYADGSRACVRNPNPRFFDQSHVIVPADKIAGAMLKVASYTGQSVEGFEMPKVIPSALVGQALAMEEAVDKAAMEKTARPIEIREGQIFWSPEQLEAQKVAASDPEFPLSLLEDLAKYPLQKVASTLAQLAIVPSPREWQYLALCHAGQEKLAQELHQAGECFDPDPRINAEPEDVDMMLVDPAAMDGEIAVKLAEWIPLRSAEPMFLAPRLSIARGELVGGEKHASALREGVGLWMRMHDKLAAAVVPPEKIRKENPRLGEIFLALAASYGMARAAGGKMYGARILADLERSTGLNPALAAALLAIGATGAIGLADKAVSPNQITRTKEAAGGPWVGGPSQSGGGFWNWIRETPEPITSVVLPFSAGYMSSAWYRAKQMRGEPTNSVQNVIADHPLASGVGATGALALIRRALRRKP